MAGHGTEPSDPVKGENFFIKRISTGQGRPCRVSWSKCVKTSMENFSFLFYYTLPFNYGI
jgi:hypothetical protein